MSNTKSCVDRRAALVAMGSAVLATGCPLSVSETLPADVPMDTEIPVNQLVADTLKRNFETRGLSSARHGAWQILHGVLAYGKEFEIETPEGNKPVVDYLLAGGRVRGFEPILGDLLSETERRGLRMPMQAESKVGQGHSDQWLAVLAQAGLKLDDQIPFGGHVFLVDDWVRQVKWDTPLNYDEEYSWTLIGLTAYRDTDHFWEARNGKLYSIEWMLERELDQDLENSACGGTHRLIGIAMTLNKRIAEGKPLNGVWAEAKKLIDEKISAAKTNQNPDGSYSTAYLHRQGWVRDLGETLGTTGHVVEFLSIAADEETLQSEWVTKSVRRLCAVLAECEGIDLECGGLYHALHALAEYQRRVG